MSLSTMKWSLEDWDRLVESGVLDEKEVELLQGEVITMAPEGFKHSGSNRNVADYLRDLFRDRALISETHPVRMTSSEPQPDIAVVKLPRETYLQRHPEAADVYLLIEISDRTLAKDLGEKAVIYARNQIPEYWVIDLQHNKVVIHAQPTDEGYTSVATVDSGTIKLVAIADAVVEVDKLLLYRDLD